MAFQASTASGQFPRHTEATRFDALVQSITSNPNVMAAWSGDYLLFSGVSHGASGPVIAMASQDFDAKPSWNGAKYTGSCFLDGAYDVAALLDFHFDNQCRA